MIRPIDIHDQLTKTALLEKIQQAEKVAEEGQQKFTHLNARHTVEKQLQTTQPSHEDERISDSYEHEHQARQEEEEKDTEARSHEEAPRDEDEPLMTQLGFEIDLLA